MSLERAIAALRTHVDREVGALKSQLAQALRMLDSLASGNPIPVREWTTAANVTITKDEVNMRHVVTNTAAIDFTLPDMDLRAFVEVMNDGASTNNVTVKDSGGTTIDTLTPGSSAVRYGPDSSGTMVPL